MSKIDVQVLLAQLAMHGGRIVYASSDHETGIPFRDLMIRDLTVDPGLFHIFICYAVPCGTCETGMFIDNHRVQANCLYKIYSITINDKITVLQAVPKGVTRPRDVKHLTKKGMEVSNVGDRKEGV